MKKFLMLFAAIMIVAGFTVKVAAQGTNTHADVTGTAAGAVLIVPMGLSETSPLHFGTIVLTTTAGGTVVLPSNSLTRGFTGGVAAAASTVNQLAVIKNAAFHVTGTRNETYALTLPSTITITETNGGVGATMTISALKVTFTGGEEVTAVAATSLLNTDGEDDFSVGGTLTVPATPVGGVYAGTFDTSVDYN